MRKRGETRTVQPSGTAQARRTQVRRQACGALRRRSVRSDLRSVSNDEVPHDKRGGAGRGSPEGHVSGECAASVPREAQPKRAR